MPLIVLYVWLSSNQVYYQANRNFPIYTEFTSILKKTSGLVDTRISLREIIFRELASNILIH